MTKIVDLHPKRSLINSKFVKYQFSPDIIDIDLDISLDNDVLRLEPQTSQESFLETRIFAFHNHLFKNPYDISCWFVDDKWNVWRINNAGVLNQIYTLTVCDDNKKTKKLFNPSIGFASKEITIILDGSQHLVALREDLMTGQIKSLYLNLEITTGTILDVRFVPIKSTLIVALCCIAENQGKKFSQVHLLFYLWKKQNSEEECFELIAQQVLKVDGAIEYIFIEEDGEHIHSISQNPIIFESPPQTEYTNEETQMSNSEPDHKEEHIKIPKYSWSQDEDSITVWIKIPENKLTATNDQITKNVKATKISISIDNFTLIEGDCQHRLDESLTTWKRENDTLQLELIKYESGLMWNELIKGDIGGEHLPNETLAAEVHSRLAHLCTETIDDGTTHGQPVLGFNSEQLEECDLQGGDNLLQRINLRTQRTTHLATLGPSNHVIFNYKTKIGQALCLRHEHDGCVWKTGEITDDNEWNVKHTSTFPGFGYVEASKSNKKFCVSPANNSYVAIVEHTRHIFLYEQPEITTEVGKQWIVDLGCDEMPIMGAVATNEYLILLTKNKLYRLKVYP